MRQTECTNCGRSHEIEDETDEFGDAGEVYVMYTCHENGTTYGVSLTEA